MPTYTYMCPKCLIEETITKSMFDTEVFVCDECDFTMRKVFNPTPAHFKGEGFYTTDKFSDR